MWYNTRLRKYFDNWEDLMEEAENSYPSNEVYQVMEERVGLENICEAATNGFSDLAEEWYDEALEEMVKADTYESDDKA